jgi:hypothetical protein
MEVALNQQANIHFSMKKRMKVQVFSYIKESYQQLRG